MSPQKHRAPRIPMQLEVEFNHEDIGYHTFKTKNISETGVFIEIPPEKHPPIGTLAHVKLKNAFADGEEPQTLEMEVVRATEDGVGLKFTELDVE
ncbi:MAG: PilZ domain-containing protein [Enterobacterales bacterium]|nr:PilZ domain-containing protein [Enterobacterales bacterium]